MTYDVIIAGGGAAGCILANRLSEDPSRSILLIEAGPDFADEASAPAPVLDERYIPMDFLWMYEGIRVADDPEPLVVVRGKVLGGSTSVNTMIYQRGAPEDYGTWGSPLWAYDELVPCFERIENDCDVRDGSRGTAGKLPLHRFDPQEWAPTQRAFVRAATDLGHAEVPDNLLTVHEGVGPVARNSVDGKRISAALAWLLPARDRPNLTVTGDALVQRVLVEDGRAVGVEIVRGDERTEVRGNEVIVAAGAIGSPQILTLSGIGPADVLERLGVPLVADLRGVGRNLTDHPVVPVVAKLKPGAEPGDARNMVALIYTATGSPTARDMFITLASGEFGAGGLAGASSGEVGVSIYSTMNLADSVGELEFVSADVRDLPRIHYRYLESGRDRERFREAIRQAAAMLDSPAFADLVAERIGPSDEQLASDDALDAWMPKVMMTALHGTGTCRMGAADDPGAVVDFEGRVHGVDGLRVIDLSIAPTVVRAPTNSTAMVIAERVADLMLGTTAGAGEAARTVTTN